MSLLTVLALNRLSKHWPWKGREPGKGREPDWMRAAILTELQEIDVAQDPVRPELDLAFRTSFNRQIYGLQHQGFTLGAICVAFTHEVPHSLRELDLLSQIAYLRTFEGLWTRDMPVPEKSERIAVGYTVWSNRSGAGRIIMDKVVAHMSARQDVDRLITLSPLTPGATHYHIRNGARLLNISLTSQNFEYDLGGEG